MKRYEQSRADMNKILELSPNHKFATDLLKRINALPRPTE
jgi:hypothetical protein